MSAPVTDIKKLYDYTLQQMAAESYLENRFAWNEKGDVIEALTKGTNRAGYQNGDPSLNQGWPGYTRMTQSQAEEFWDNFKIVHQWSDDPTPTGYRPGAQGNPAFAQLNDEILANTGFSATLIQDKRTGEYTLSIRSTEFRPWDKGGDAERDKSATDIMGIGLTGFALAQLDALDQYYQWLKDNNYLPCGATLNVTGYSLGGHLATVFTEMHQNDSYLGNFGETVVFNGAGRGTWNSSVGNESDMIAYYHQVLNDRC